MAPSRRKRCAKPLLTIDAFDKKTAHAFHVERPDEQQIASLMRRKEVVLAAHNNEHAEQLERLGVQHIHGRAGFHDPHTIAVTGIGGSKRLVHATTIVIAVGSRPRAPANIPIDHEHLLDSDSFAFDDLSTKDADRSGFGRYRQRICQHV